MEWEENIRVRPGPISLGRNLAMIATAAFHSATPGTARRGVTLRVALAQVGLLEYRIRVLIFDLQNLFLTKGSYYLESDWRLSY